MSKPRVIIEVRGGRVQAVHSSIDISVDILDYDNMSRETDEEEIVRQKNLEEEIKTLPHRY